MSHHLNQPSKTDVLMLKTFPSIESFVKLKRFPNSLGNVLILLWLISKIFKQKRMLSIMQVNWYKIRQPTSKLFNCPSSVGIVDILLEDKLRTLSLEREYVIRDIRWVTSVIWFSDMSNHTNLFGFHLRLSGNVLMTLPHKLRVYIH